MAEYKVIKGDATRPEGEGEKLIIIPHVCNDIGAWGSGFVLAINKRWGNGPVSAYKSWSYKQDTGDIMEFLEKDGITKDELNILFMEQFRLGAIQLLKVPNKVVLINMIAQHGCGDGEDGRPPIRYGSLAACMKSVKYMVKDRDCEIHCPKFGSNLSGGHWPTIELMIKEIWVDAGIPVFVYEWGG